MGAANYLHQRWVMDLVLLGPDAGNGGKHLLLPPGYTGEIPGGYFAAIPLTDRVLVLLRAIPPAVDNAAANALVQTVKLYPVNHPADWQEPKWRRFGEGRLHAAAVETSLKYWQVLKEIIDLEPGYKAYRGY